jgi:CRISPR system Cascade subunit CasE
MFLSRLILNPRSNVARGLVSDCARLHTALLTALPALPDENARQRHGVLHRLEIDERTGALVLLAQSLVEPDWSSWSKEAFAPVEHAAECRPLELSLRAGMTLQFRLMANVTRRIDTKSGPDGARRHGRRVPLRDLDAAMAWLHRKAPEAGFEVVQEDGRPLCEARHEPATTGTRQGKRLTFEGVRFDGLLRVTDAERLHAAVVAGIGPAKAYGFGLLSLRRPG